jgi:starvation-inducible DNA-binding protein
MAASSELIDNMKVVLADTFTMYMKTHGYHWNVIGSDFPQLHEFFGDIYGELHGAADDIAEQIRQIDSFSPGTLTRMIELATVVEDEKIPVAANMVNNLIAANDAVLTTLMTAYKQADADEEYGLANFLQDRMMAHKKHGWMLKATSGKKASNTATLHSVKGRV